MVMTACGLVTTVFLSIKVSRMARAALEAVEAYEN